MDDLVIPVFAPPGDTLLWSVFFFFDTIEVYKTFFFSQSLHFK